MKTYEIINPSDHVLVSSDNELAACIAVLMLGQGKFGLREAEGDGKDVLPLFLFGGAEQWLEQKGIHDLAKWFDENMAPLAVVFESAFYGSVSEMKGLDRALAGLPEAEALERKRLYNDERRSSMNDIGAACTHWAKVCRERLARRPEARP